MELRLRDAVAILLAIAFASGFGGYTWGKSRGLEAAAPHRLELEQMVEHLSRENLQCWEIQRWNQEQVLEMGLWALDERTRLRYWLEARTR